MSDDNIKTFPQRNRSLGMPAQAATIESELDPRNPLKDSLRGLLEQRQHLIDQYGTCDGSVHEIERAIAERLVGLAGR